MIKIWYGDLPGGLHVRAVARGKDTIIYLLPGLTVAERRAALRRVRSSARMGHGPALSAVGLALAVMTNRIRTTVRNVASAMRMHPGMFVPLLVILLSAPVAYFVLTSVSIKIHSPQASGPQTALAPPIAAAAGPSHDRGPRSPGQPGALVPGRPSPGRSGAPTPRQSGRGHPSPSPAPTMPGQPPGPAPTMPGLPPGPAPSPNPSSGPSPSPSPSPTPTWSDAGGGLCVNVARWACLPV